MTHRLFASALVIASALVACGVPSETASSGASALARSDAGFEWSVPEHWAKETIPFPLSFAPELPYTGVEELRFMPRFFDPTAETYFSYSFVWLLDGADAGVLDADRLGKDLVTYYAGLARSADPTHFDASVHHAELTTAKDGHIRGTVETADGFNASVPLRLEADLETTSCGARRVVLATLSPHSLGDATWTTLLEQRRTFRCTP